PDINGLVEGTLGGPGEILEVIANVCDVSGKQVGSVKDFECCGCNNQPATCVGQPIRVSNGNMRYSDRDPIPPLAGGLARDYDSESTDPGVFGTSWMTTFDAWLRERNDGGGALTVVIGTPDK